MNSDCESDSDEVVLTIARTVVATTTAIVSEIEESSTIKGRESGYPETVKVEMTVCDTPTYDDKIFKRHFRMSRGLFNKIVMELQQNFSYFQKKSRHSGYTRFHNVAKVYECYVTT
jgi:hypothetical protein